MVNPLMTVCFETSFLFFIFADEFWLKFPNHFDPTHHAILSSSKNLLVVYTIQLYITYIYIKIYIYMISYIHNIYIYLHKKKQTTIK